MIHIVEGDLLASDCTVIAHQANCFNTMMSGIAKQISSKYPEALAVDRRFGTPDSKLGKCSFIYYDKHPLLIFNLYGQYRYGRREQHTDYNALSSAIHQMFEVLRTNSYYYFNNTPMKIGMPFGLGAGLGGGDFNIIYDIIKYYSDGYGYDVYLHKL